MRLGIAINPNLSVLLLAALGTTAAFAKDCLTNDPADYQVFVYQNASYGGQCSSVEVGWYPHAAAFQMDNDSVSSIKVGRRVMATLFSDAYYSGRAETLYFGSYRLTNNLIGNDAVSSLKVEYNNWPSCNDGKQYAVNRTEWKPASECKNLSPALLQVILYKDANFGGDCSVNGLGSYPHGASFSLDNDSVSSIKVGSGVLATLYSDAYYTGRAQTFPTTPNSSRQITSLSSEYIGNDSASSLLVNRMCFQ